MDKDPIDLTPIGQLAADLMEQLDDGGDYELQDAILAVEIMNSDGSTTILRGCTSDRHVVAAGLAAFLYKATTEGQNDEYDEIDEDDDELE